jgi:dipeptidyl aminopeptidase/acylaminoacyl peptidase
LAAADGSEQPRPFTAGEHRDTVPRWSPDGRHLAFVSHRHEPGSEVYVLSVKHGGEAVKVCSWPADIVELAWSPDGNRLAFVARDPDPERYGKLGETRPDKDMPPRRVTRLFSRLNGGGWIFDTPVLLVHSEDDLRCPINQAEELFVGLRLLGRDPELVRFPGETHDLSRTGSPRHRVMRAELILEWFGGHLQP